MKNLPNPQLGLKISSRGLTKYAPIEMTDETVFDFAQNYYTAEEIAERFNVSKTTLLKHHGDAFRAGKEAASNVPRMLLAKIFKDFSGEMNFSRMDVPTNTLLKAIELHAKKYEGLGQKTEVHHTGVGYDKVESAPVIIERPDDEA